MPSHSNVSILYGTKPLGQRDVGSVRKASRASPVPRWVSGTAMSPSTKLGFVWGGTKFPRKSAADSPPGVAKNNRRQIRSMFTCVLEKGVLPRLMWKLVWLSRCCSLVPRICSVYLCITQNLFQFTGSLKIFFHVSKPQKNISKLKCYALDLYWRLTTFHNEHMSFLFMWPSQLKFQGLFDRKRKFHNPYDFLKSVCVCGVRGVCGQQIMLELATNNCWWGSSIASFLSDKG